MTRPFVVSIPHRLGKDEATRRLKSGIEKARTDYGHIFAIQEAVWSEDRLQFRVSALGQTANGTLDVAEAEVHLQIYLPWLLAKAAAAIQPLLRQEGVLLLEKK